MKRPKLGTNQKGRPELQPMARVIQAAMQQRGMDVAALTEAMGMTVEQRGAVANWVVGKNAPSSLLRPRLASVLGLDEAQLSVPGFGKNNGKMDLKQLGPAQRAVALVETARVNGEIIPAPPPVTDVFTFRARSDGNAVVRLDVNLPFAKAAQLIQFLIGFGLAPGAEEHHE